MAKLTLILFVVKLRLSQGIYHMILTGFHAVCTPKIQMSSTPAHPRFKFSSKLAHRIDISLLHLRALLLAYMACRYATGPLLSRIHWGQFLEVDLLDSKVDLFLSRKFLSALKKARQRCLLVMVIYLYIPHNMIKTKETSTINRRVIHARFAT